MPAGKPSLAHDGRSGVVVLVVATAYTAGLHNLVLTLDRYGFGWRVLGFGDKSPWTWRLKMRLVADGAAAVAAQHGPDTLVVSSDGYDVLAVRSASRLKRLWRELQARPAPPRVVLGAERLCLPVNCGDVSNWWARQSAARREAAGSMYYANGGHVTGAARHVAEYYTWMLDAGEENDQRGMSHYAQAYPALVELDAESRFVFTQNPALPGDPDTEAGRGAVFYHAPSLKHWRSLYRFEDLSRRHAGAFAVPVVPLTKHALEKYVLGLAVLLLLVAAFLLGRRVGRRAALALALVAPA